MPGEEVNLAKQTEVQLASRETIHLPVRITPYSRRLIGIRKRRYSFTITTNIVEGQQLPRSMLGQLWHKVLLRPLFLLLIAL